MPSDLIYFDAVLPSNPEAFFSWMKSTWEKIYSIPIKINIIEEDNPEALLALKMKDL